MDASLDPQQPPVSPSRPPSHHSWFSWVPKGFLLRLTLPPLHSLRGTGTDHDSGGSVLDKERTQPPHRGPGPSGSTPAGLDSPVVCGGCPGPLGWGCAACRSWKCAQAWQPWLLARVCGTRDAERPLGSGLGLGWAILRGGRTRPRGRPAGQELTCLSCCLEGLTCAAPAFMPTAVLAGGRCRVGTSV